MAGFARHLVLIVLLSALVALSLPNVPANANSFNPTPATSSPDSFAPTENSILDFSVAGSNGKDFLDVTAAGGSVTLSGTEYRVWPWHHVKADFAGRPMWIVFLANVTSDDFRIMFLYLTNQTTAFALRIFDYGAGTLEMRPFDGTQLVSERTVPVSRPASIPLVIKPEAKTSSEVSILGSRIYVNNRFGRAYEGVQELTIYPIYNQVYANEGEFNELWALIKTNDGSLYYSIFYLQNGDEATLYRGHTLRLNDFAYMNWNTYQARWMKGQFPGELRIRTLFENLTISLDGFPFTTSEDGSLKVKVPNGRIGIETEPIIQTGPGTREVFTEWSDGSPENPRTLQVDGTQILAAKYRSQFLLQISSVPQPYDYTGWYDENSQVEVRLPDTNDYGNGTRQVFLGWTGDIQSTNVSLSMVMNSPKKIEAKWQLQYLLTIQLSGIPDGTSVELRINGSPKEITTSLPLSEWVEAGSTVSILPERNQTVIKGEAYSLESWVVGSSNQRLNMPLQITAPTNIRANFRVTSVYASSLDFRLSASTVAYGAPIDIQGRLNPGVAGAEVILSASQDNSTWSQIGQAKTNADGSFTFRWAPAGKGTFYLQANWPGNNELQGSTSPVRTVNVIEYGQPIKQPLGSLQNQTRRIITSNPTVNAAYVIVAGPAIAIFDIANNAAPSLTTNPIASQVAYYAITGALLGLVYVLPLAVLASTFRALRRGRAAGPKGSIIVLFVWIVVMALSFAAAFGILTLAGTLLTALLVLVMAASAFMLPMLLSLAVTHIIAP